MAVRRRAVAGLLVLAVGALGGAWWISGHTSAESTRKTAPTVVSPDFGRRVRVEVLNAGGRQGAARDATELLRRDGFDVVYFGNAAKFGQDSSIVLDRVGNMDMARAVAKALGIGNVDSKPDPNLYLDVSVRLGSDWHPPSATPHGAGTTARRSRWDPRTWLGR